MSPVLTTNLQHISVSQINQNVDLYSAS